MNCDIPERYSIREWIFFDRNGAWSGTLYLPFTNDANIDDKVVVIYIIIRQMLDTISVCDSTRKIYILKWNWLYLIK